MQLTNSHAATLPATVRSRYDIVEVRSAAAVIAASNPAELGDLIAVLDGFTLTVPYLLDAGGSKSAAAKDLDAAFRKLGWRETSHQLTITSTVTRNPWRAGGETAKLRSSSTNVGDSHQVDNVKGRVAIEVEWNAKDGNLDRDLAAFRALYDAGIIDAGVIITRSQASTHYLANKLAHQLGRVNVHPRSGNEVERFNTTTTTNLERLEWRLTRGDAGGCPVLGVGICHSTYKSGQAYLDHKGAPRKSPAMAKPPADILAALSASIRAQAAADEADGADEEE